MYKIYTKILCWPDRHVPKILLIMTSSILHARSHDTRKQLLRIMKLTTVLLIVTMMQVSAATFAQNITLKKQNVSLDQLFKEIRKQTGYAVIWSGIKIKETKTINANFENTPLEQVLSTTLKTQKLNYEIDNKNIIVTRARETILDKMIARFQEIDVRGRLVDEKGYPLAGATVTVKGSSKTTSTNTNGEFYLSGVDEKALLVISFVGYKPLGLIAKADMGDVKLEMTSGELQEVVINKGYYTIKQELNTGSVGRITAEEISKQPISNPLLTMQGRIPGIYISQTSGVTGSAPQVTIRGRNSLREGASDPLYVIDGIPFNSASLSQSQSAVAGSQTSPLNSIRPEEIESINVLRDADATAIYGSRGANGVVLINTKRGTSGRSVFNLNVYHGFSNVPKFLGLMNSAQYLEMRNEGLQNDKVSADASEYDVNGGWTSNNNNNQTTDWQKILISGTAKVTNASASISGGNPSLFYIAGLSYRNETTVFPGEFANKIGSANASITHNSEDKKLQVTTSVNYSNNNNKLPMSDLTSFIFVAPNAPDLYLPNGSINWQDNKFNNPLATLYQRNTAVAENFIGNISGKYRILAGLDFKANIGYNSIRFNETALVPFLSINPANTPASDSRNITVGSNEIRSWITEPQLTYTKRFGQHQLDALAATTFQAKEQKGLLVFANGFASDILLENLASGSYRETSNSNAQYRYNAFFARIGYNFAEKYVLNLTGRRDGSSRFGPGEQYGNFGAIGTAWIFSKENWLAKHFPLLSFGKVRASIGKTGNDQISDYNYLSLYSSPIGYYGTSGLYPSKIGNPNYRWETINKTEVGLDLGFIKDRIMLTGSYYRNRTSNQLVGYNLPSFTGFNSIQANLPAVIQNSGFEGTLNTINIEDNSFNWNTSFNVTVPRNKLVKYENLETSSYAESFRIGYPLDVSLLFKYNGVDENTGLYTFEDLDNNGSMTTEQDKYPVSIGQKFYGGLNNSFLYKGFSLDFLFQFVKQTGRRYIAIASPGSYLGIGTNVETKFLDRWQQAGDIATYQRYGGFSGESPGAFDNYLRSDAIVSDASFIKLRNVSFAYHLPSIWLDRMKVQNLKLYLQGQNLLTISRFDGLDPETSAAVNAIGLPLLRVITAGIQISL
ncbi:MAG: SusC/RagA family TonB-linked outer membrane protein [Chryseobacterium sp.]|nr:MAG: SusC/RagA family TonB-linked outer membrane protein [Chryseobacterium sp.]